MLRSMRFSEADRILHLYTEDRGRIGAIAKGVRKTKSRFGARLEPLSHVELMLHEGAGELQTITGVELLRSHHATREEPVPARRRPDRRRGDAAALRRAGGERARVRGAHALPRPARRRAAGGGAARRSTRSCSRSSSSCSGSPGYLPHVTSCVECGARRARRLLGARRRRRVRACTPPARCALSPEGSPGSSGCSRRRSRTRPARRSRERARRDALAVDHLVVRGARRVPAEDALGVRRELGGGVRARRRPGRASTVAEVHRFLCEESTGRPAAPRETQDRLIDEAARVVGLYDGERQIGFCRAATDGVVVRLPRRRLRARGVPRPRARRGARARDGRARRARTPQVAPAHGDMHALYRKLGFDVPNAKVMERLPSP